MSTKALLMTKGNPYESITASRNFIKDYEFETIEIDGDLERRVLAEASAWDVVTEVQNIYNHEDMGVWESGISTEVTPLLDSGSDFIIWNDILAGVRYRGTLYFMPQGNYVGGNFECVTNSSTDRSEDYDKYTFSIRKRTASEQVVYYKPTDDNPLDTVYGVDPMTEHIEIAEGTRAIMHSAFRGAQAKSISLPASFREITTIESLSFTGDNLRSIEVSPLNPVFRSNGTCLINVESKTVVAGTLDCEIPSDGSVKKLGEFLFYRSPLKSIVIPEGIYQIKEYAFDQSDLRKVVLPISLVKVGKGAFGYCNYLKVYYAGTLEQWKDSGLHPALGYGTKVYTYLETEPKEKGDYWHCVDGEIVEW